MIRNLNRMTIKDFGQGSPEQQRFFDPAFRGDRQEVLQLTPGDAPIYKTDGSTWLMSGGGMVVLSLSLDGEDFQHFYLDKLVCLRPGNWFALSPFRENNAAARISSEPLPAHTGRFLRSNNFQLNPQLQVTALYTFFYHEKAQGFFFPGEAHPMLELTYVDQGSLHSVADGQDLLLQKGDLAIYGPDQWHMQYADMDVAPRYVTISFDIKGELPSRLLGRKFTGSQQIVTLLQQMVREQESTDEHSAGLVISLLSQLLILLARQENSAGSRLRPSNSLHSENEIIRRAQQYISEHIRQKLSVPVVASAVDVSASYLTALFHKHLQISPGEYIRRIKLQESKQMIRENSMNFTEIAAELQYSTVHHFSCQFKEKFGITPTEYAKSVR